MKPALVDVGVGVEGVGDVFEELEELEEFGVVGVGEEDQYNKFILGGWRGGGRGRGRGRMLRAE